MSGEPLFINCTVSESNPPANISLVGTGFTKHDATLMPNLQVVSAVTSALNGSIYTCTADSGVRTATLSFRVVVIQTVTCKETNSSILLSQSMKFSI